MPSTELPSFAELPIDSRYPPSSAWGLWGDDDELGTLNLLNDQRTLAALAHVRDGAVFNLNLPLDQPWRPEGSRRGNPEHHILHIGYEHRNWEPGGVDDPSTGGIARDDYIGPLWLQGSTQWDGVAHVRHPEHGNYNGIPDHDIHGEEGARLGIDKWAPRGVVGRAVLADVARHRASVGRPIDQHANDVITAEDLRDTLDSQGVQTEVGDILLLRTGWMGHYRAAPEDYKRRIYTPEGMRVPGLDSSTDMLELLWDSHFAAVAADNIAVEHYPAQVPGRDWALHLTLLPLWGMALGESWWLDDLADACAADQRYLSLLVSVPLNVRGGMGSPPSAAAIR